MKTIQLAQAQSLLGVPHTLKAVYGAKGFPFTAGIVSRRDILAEEDSFTLQRFGFFE